MMSPMRKELAEKVEERNKGRGEKGKGKRNVFLVAFVFRDCEIYKLNLNIYALLVS